MLTKTILIITFIFLIVYDAIVDILKQPTESQVLLAWGWQFNALPLTAGILIGHWFFPHKSSTLGSIVGLVLPFIAAALIWDLIWNLKFGGEAWFRYPGFYALLGIPIGSYLWSQFSSGSPL